MKNKFLALIVCSLILGSIKLHAQCAQEANVFSFTYAGKNYEVVKEKRLWASASACAVERGGYLVEINDSNEQNAVYAGILSAGVSPTYTSIDNGGGIAYVWIGATDQTNEGTWIWNGNNDTSGINFWTGQGANGLGNGIAVNGRYFNWGGKSTGTPNEPDNYAPFQNHAAIGLAGWPAGSSMLGKAGEWNDIQGSSLLYYVIEKTGATGLLDLPKQKALTLFPNPCSNTITLLGSNIPSQCAYEIYDTTGKIVLADALPSLNQIAVEGLIKGLYFLKLEGYETSFMKFVVE
ncbi:MAG: hypothetical protein CFE21_03455 [Bacteroidetes bacterium B1(2017)]|nr:MAG: hypothetical protein CFE21_03455 [Bacteroidetes bacterium B1(2017)]